MKNKFFAAIILLTGLTIFTNCNSNAQDTAPKVNPEIWVRPGYELTIAVSSDLRARHMALGPDGTLYYTTTPDNVIIAAKDKNHDGRRRQSRC